MSNKPISFPNKEETKSLKLECLRPFANHPFKLYENDRLDDLAQSIKQNGLFEPIIVRPIDDENYEILAGHNRFYAAKQAGLDTISACIRYHLSDEDAQIIVVESNFNQRSTNDMKPSELANSLYMLNEATKKKAGRRSDLEEPKDCSQSNNRQRTMKAIGEKHNLSQATIGRYLRIALLSKELQAFLDDGKIGFGVAEKLSYLRSSEQRIVHSILLEGEEIDARQAQELKKQSKNHELTKDEIHGIIYSKPQALKKKRSIKLSENFLEKYFSKGETQEEIEDTIAKALDLLKSENLS